MYKFIKAALRMSLDKPYQAGGAATRLKYIRLVLDWTWKFHSDTLPTSPPNFSESKSAIMHSPTNSTLQQPPLISMTPISS